VNVSKVEDKLKEMGLELPASPAPVANYVRAVQTGNLVYLAGHGPARSGDGYAFVGKVGRDLTTEQGYAAARSVALNLLASLKEAIGDLDRVRRIVKMLGMVNCTEDFYEQPHVINGASDLLVELFGERGRHARSAVGMQSLPGTARGSIPVEIEIIVEVE
jgi:enamine deaminase RidA (YjgF/YER057c/UK114 family)